MNTHILASRVHIIHFLNITTFHLLKKNGFQLSYMTVLSVDVINTSIKQFKLLLQNRFQNMLRLFTYRISMDTKGPINPPSHTKYYIHVIIDAFSHFVVTVPIQSNNAKTAIKIFLHLHGFPMFLLHFLNILVIFLLNVEYIFLHFFS